MTTLTPAAFARLAARARVYGVTVTFGDAEQGGGLWLAWPISARNNAAMWCPDAAAADKALDKLPEVRAVAA